MNELKSEEQLPSTVDKSLPVPMLLLSYHGNCSNVILLEKLKFFH